MYLYFIYYNVVTLVATIGRRSRHNRRTPLVRDHAIRRPIKAHGNVISLISTRRRYPNLVYCDSKFYLNYLIKMAVVKVQFGTQDLEVVSLRDEEGQLWMLANPFARILEYSNAPKAISTNVTEKNQRFWEELKSYHSGTTSITSSLQHENIKSRQFIATQVTSSSQHENFRSAPPGQTSMTSLSIQAKSKFINRAGLFELIQASKMPKAQEFRNWINSDLLVKLCDTGEYHMQTDAPADIAEGMNAVHVATNDGKEAPWMKDLSELKQIVALKDQIIAIKDEENKKLTVNLQEANQNLIVANQGLLQAFNIVNEARIDSENARKDTAELANRMADIAQDVIAKPANPQLLHSLAVCSMGGDQYAFVRPQKRSLKRSLDRLAVEEQDIVFKSDYVPNGVNVLNKVKETLPKNTFTARHNKITLLNDMTKEELVDVISSTMTTRQLALAKKKL
ncbi:bro [Peridroma alphabaculovirus]|uniref:Bro n=1 Tax=Peridroma alphabaculovirus TaxID=1346829 RepID=A0A068LKN0_9ABAC|nr:bro [Peridroma alphabaculovirus]AIE47748.1 bro [Peridroma alphabaculovirus]